MQTVIDREIEQSGLPCNIDAERLVLGSVLLDDTQYTLAASSLGPDDFTLSAHKTIFRAMGELFDAGIGIDRVSISNKLIEQRKLDSVGGITYVVSLDDGLPQIVNLEGYIRIIRDKSMKRRLILSAQMVLTDALLDGRDSAQMIQDATQSMLGLNADLPSSGLVPARKIIADIGIDALLRANDNGLKTGYQKFDEMTGGLQKGDLIIVAARPSMGKTAWALNIAWNMARRGKSVAFFSLEMSRESILRRLICSTARVNGQTLRDGRLDQDARARVTTAAAEIADTKLFLDDSGVLSLASVHSKLRRLRSEGTLDIAIIDYIGLMETGSRENRNNELGMLSRGLKVAAKDLDIPIVALSQLSRGPEHREDKKPKLSDIRESGNIEQDADVVAFLYREEYYKPDREDLRGIAELIVGKQRNGPIGTVRLVFLKEIAKFEMLMSE